MLKTLNFNKSLEETRKEFDEMSGTLKIPKDLSIEYIDSNGVKGELYSPKSASGEVLYYLHGGGYCLGLNNIGRKLAIFLAKTLKREVFLLDYRLAPENPYPAGVNDTYRGYNWLINRGYKPNDITIYGESAGCGLALSCILTLRDKNRAQPKCIFFSTPFLDATMSGDTVKSNAEKDPYYCDKEYYISNYYVGNEDPKDPRISPIFNSMKNLPPFLVHGAEYDMLLCNTLDFQKRVSEAGGKIEVKIWKGLWHVFHLNYNLIPEGKKAIYELREFIESI